MRLFKKVKGQKWRHGLNFNSLMRFFGKIPFQSAHSGSRLIKSRVTNIFFHKNAGLSTKFGRELEEYRIYL